MSGRIARLRSAYGSVFASLSVPNYRYFVVGHAISLVGGWMQIVAQGWLVLQITGSPAALGAVAAVQTVPVLLFAPYGGVIADRVDKRKLLIWVQFASCLVSAILGVLVLTDVVVLWQIYVLAFVVGLLRCLDNPARQSFVHEIVSQRHLHNAVTFNAVLLNTARVIGPTIAGATIVLGGIGLCFLLNALSFLAMVAVLVRMNVADLASSKSARRSGLREGFAYIRRTPTLAIPLAMTGIIGCLAFEFPVVLPIIAERVLHGDAQTYGFLTAAMGAGAIVGGLSVSALGRTGIRMLVYSALALGATMLLAAAASNLVTMLIAMTAVGVATISTTATSNSTLQLEATPGMRGRVMALWSVGMMGSTAIGGPIVGVAMEHFGARIGFVIGGVGCLAAAALGLSPRLRRTDPAPAAIEPQAAQAG